MTEEVNMTIDMASESMDAAIQHLEKELATVRAGKASPSMLNSVFVDYYGSQSPVQQVASVSTQDGRTLAVKPWEKAMLPIIEKALFAANLGITPQNDGETIRLTIPPLTGERRKSLAKQIRAYGENAKVSIRKARQEANGELKQLKKDGLSEDATKTAEGRVQEETNKYAGKIDKLVAAKEAEVMEI